MRLSALAGKDTNLKLWMRGKVRGRGWVAYLYECFLFREGDGGGVMFKLLLSLSLAFSNSFSTGWKSLLNQNTKY